MDQKILVVDDEKPIADILKFNLENEGYEVICAYDGDEAIELTHAENPDLILLDIMLPKRDGNEVRSEERRVGKEGRCGRGSRRGGKRDGRQCGGREDGCGQEIA